MAYANHIATQTKIPTIPSARLAVGFLAIDRHNFGNTFGFLSA